MATTLVSNTITIRMLPLRLLELLIPMARLQQLPQNGRHITRARGSTRVLRAIMINRVMFSTTFLLLMLNFPLNKHSTGGNGPLFQDNTLLLPMTQASLTLTI